MALRGPCTSNQDAESTTQTVVILTFPGGTAVGDVIVAATVNNTGTATVTGTSGANTWTVTQGPVYQSANTAYVRFIRKLDAVDIATGSVTFTWSALGRIQASGNIYSGGAGTWQTPPTPTQAAASTVAAPALTTVGNNSDVAVDAVVRTISGTIAVVSSFGASYTVDATNATNFATSGVNMSSGVGHLTTPVAAGTNVGGQTVASGGLGAQIIAGIVELDPAPPAAVRTARPGPVWKRRFKHRQIPQPFYSATQTLVADATISATATVSATAVLEQQAAATISATATVAATATQTFQAAASISATATVTAAATLVQPAAATISATATVTAGATVVEQAVANITATATVTATPTLTQFATITVAPTASVTAAATLVQPAVVTVTATATVASAGVVSKVATISITPTAAVSAAATQTFFASIVASAIAFLTSSATVVPVTGTAVGQPLQAALNRVAGTVGLDAQGAANIWAGTVGLDLIGALNVKAATSGYDFLKVLNTLAGTTGLDEEGCAGNLH